MSAYEVKDKLVEAINQNIYDFIVVNYANGDMVGHTGIYDAIAKAIVAVDACVKETIEAAKAQGYEAIIIADHAVARSETIAGIQSALPNWRVISDYIQQKTETFRIACISNFRQSLPRRI